jgi:hypothetical protein
MADAFSARVRSWLEAVRPGLGLHASVIFDYGATSHYDMASLDSRDIKALEARFTEAGVAPLQVRRITDMLPGMINESKAAISTPAGGKQPASAGAAASNSTGDAGRRRQQKQRQEATDSEDDGLVDDDESDEDEEDGSEYEPEEEAGEDDREEAGGGGGSRSVQQTHRPRARKGAAKQQKRGEAAANGKAPVPNMFGRSSAPSGNRHGLGGQASAASAAAGRANPFANTGIGGRGLGDFCKKPCGDGAMSLLCRHVTIRKVEFKINLTNWMCTLITLKIIK